MDYFYKTITVKVIDEIFGDEGELLADAVYEDQHVLRERGEQKSAGDIERIIALGKPSSVVDTFIAIHLESRQWAWFDAFADYEIAFLSIEAWNTQFAGEYSHTITHKFYDEDTDTHTETSEDITFEAKALPDAPERPPLETVDEYRASSLTPKSSKMVGVEFEGVMCSATAPDMWGLSSVEAYIRGGIDTPFKFENGNNLLLTSENIDAFIAVWIPFRAGFFDA
jgi:hypothetical protein